MAVVGGGGADDEENDLEKQGESRFCFDGSLSLFAFLSMCFSSSLPLCSFADINMSR